MHFSIILLIVLVLSCTTSTGRRRRSYKCEESSLIEREDLASTVLTGTVYNVNRGKTREYDALILVKRVLKGDRDLAGHKVIIQGFGNPQICENAVNQRDTRIFLLEQQDNGYLRINSSVLRMSLRNLDEIVSAVKNLPYRRRPNIPEKPCEKMYCAYGSQCLVDVQTQQAYCRCHDSCSDVFASVCGSDGTTYASNCHLLMASCAQQKRITIKHQGECDVEDPCSKKQCSFGAECKPSLDGRTAECVCPEKCSTYGDSTGSKPVCGTDGNDYDNYCELKRTSCIEMRQLEKKYSGRCDPCEGVECPSSQVCQLDHERNAICRCNSVCTQALKPVCGSDGKTYKNECTLRVEACKSRKIIRIVYNEECNKVQNPCEKLKCGPGEECEIDKQGYATCKCHYVCESVMRPVCGTDGQTYYNECDLQLTACQNQRTVAVAYSGECGDTGQCHNYRCSHGAVCVLKNGQPGCECPTCSEEFEPVCGEDGMSYTNLCKMRREACEKRKEITVAYEGLCNTCDQTKCEYYSVCELDSKGHATCLCPQSCVQMEAKVCGNDGVTYQNECELRVAACTKKLYIVVASKGPCDLCINVHCKYGARCEDGRCVCPTECPSTFEPVCSSDGSTYDNDCEMRRAACIQTQEFSILFYGECDDVGASGAGAKSPETGSGTFACEEEPCQFEGICDYDSEGQPLCICSFNCPAIREPVCGSDGKIHDNDCKMREESCKKQKRIYVVPKNKCQKRKEVACDGEKPLVNPVTGKDYFCGKGSDYKKCPPSSYCHKTSEFAKCCREVAVIKSCADTPHGCCPDGKTAAQGPGQGGCPSVCNCNKLGSYSMTCDPVSMQCPCKPGVGGLKCDRCDPGFWGLHKISEGGSGCTPCSCNAYGSVRDDCEQMTGRCVCRHGIQGMKCNICPPGTVLGLDGCMDASIAKAVSGSCKQLQCFHGATCKEKEGEAQCICDFKCSSEDRKEPVCGSDGNTYGSECQLFLFSCRYQKAIEVINNGTCKKVMSTASSGIIAETTTVGPSRRSTELKNLTDTENKQTRDATENVPENLLQTDETVLTTTLSTIEQTKIEIPLFSGHSYLELPKLEAYNRLTLELEFRTLAKDGILLYNGQKLSGHGDYISLAIKDNLVEFRYNLGNGAVVLRSPQKLQLGKFHRVTAKRYLTEGMLKVDGGFEITGKSIGNRNSLDLEQNLFLGYVPALNNQVSENIGVKSGLIGCIRHFKIGKRQVDITYRGKEVINAKDIRECVDDSCTSMPCLNGASCTVFDDMNFKCICAPHYSGRHCEIPLNPCATNQCSDGYACVPFENGTFACKCVLETVGKDCEPAESEDEALTVDFNGDSYLEFPTLSNVGHAFTLEIWFLTRTFNGILLYNGQKTSGKGDFIAITLNKGFLHFIYNLGSGPANLRSSEPVSLGVWHSAKFTRLKRKGTLQIDGGQEITGESKASLSELNLELPLYVGGVPDIKLVSRVLSVSTGFDGAIQRMIINGDAWTDLMVYSTNRYSVKRYKGLPCTPNPCQNGGTCMPHLEKKKCLCVGNFSGSFCEDSISVEINDFASYRPVSFNGANFLKFSTRNRRGERLKMKTSSRQRDNHFEFTFRTHRTDGLLLWTNKGTTIHGDYLAVAIVDGRMHLSFNLGKQIEQMTIESAERVDDNNWHTVIIKRSKRLGLLSVDGHTPATNTSEPGATELNTDGVLWIGGSSFMPLGFPSAYYTGFVGCIVSVLVDGESLHLSNQETGEIDYCKPS